MGRGSDSAVAVKGETVPTQSQMSTTMTNKNLFNEERRRLDHDTDWVK